MGMLATVINALALQDILEKKGVDTRVMTAIRMEELAEPYIRRRAVRHLEKGRMVIFAGGTGNPYFSTDTAAVLRALEIEAKVLLKATNVDGVYTADPKQDPKAKFLAGMSVRDSAVNGYAVMAANASGLCKENKLPIVVFNINQPGATARVLAGEHPGRRAGLVDVEHDDGQLVLLAEAEGVRVHHGVAVHQRVPERQLREELRLRVLFRIGGVDAVHVRRLEGHPPLHLVPAQQPPPIGPKGRGSRPAREDDHPALLEMPHRAAP